MIRALGLLVCLLFISRYTLSKERIRDNLFVLEEAYNQEPGVVQHIFGLEVSPGNKSWTLSFTDEWPVPTDLNQLSLMMYVHRPEYGHPAFGDLLINYRIQAVALGGQGPIAMAPRISLVLPTGSVSKGGSRGAIGVETNLPVSIELGRFAVTHFNAGLRITPSAHRGDGRTETAIDASAGFAFVLQPLCWLNPFVEVFYANEEVLGHGSSRQSSVLVSPSVRFAIDFEQVALQVVPGMGAPFQVWPERRFFLLFYISFEHKLF